MKRCTQRTWRMCLNYSWVNCFYLLFCFLFFPIHYFTNATVRSWICQCQLRQYSQRKLNHILNCSEIIWLLLSYIWSVIKMWIQRRDVSVNLKPNQYAFGLQFPSCENREKETDILCFYCVHACISVCVSEHVWMCASFSWQEISSV